MNSNQPLKRKVVVLENGLISSYTMREALMRELLHNNFEVYILTHTNQFQKEVEAMGLNVIHVGSGNTSIFKIGNYIRRVYSAMKSIKPDICLTFSVRPAVWGNFVARQLNIPVITNISGIGPLFTSNNIAYRFLRKVYPFALQKTKKVFFQNKEDQQVFINYKLANVEKTEWIPGSGVDYNKFKPVLVEKSESGFVFLFIGRLIKDKGILEFVEAAKLVKASNPEISFKVIGPLWHQNLKSNLLSESNLNEWIEQGIIEYLGEKRDVRPYIAEADCVVLPSYREGISNVLLESSSMEKPCIATNVTGCKEVIEDGKTGLLCSVKNSSDLAKKMRQMALMPESALSEMGKQARQKVIKEFDKQIVLDRYIKEIESLLVYSEEKTYSLTKLVKGNFNSRTSLTKSNAI